MHRTISISLIIHPTLCSFCSYLGPQTLRRHFRPPSSGLSSTALEPIVLVTELISLKCLVLQTWRFLAAKNQFKLIRFSLESHVTLEHTNQNASRYRLHCPFSLSRQTITIQFIRRFPFESLPFAWRCNSPMLCWLALWWCWPILSYCQLTISPSQSRWGDSW